jgi:DNA-binding transcriptional regulator YiaG
MANTKKTTSAKKENERPLNHIDGNKIKHVRDMINMNQVEFSESLDISQAALSYLEKGETTMSFPVFKNLIQVHNVNPYYFINDGGNEPVFMAAKKQNLQERELKNKVAKLGQSAERIVSEANKMLQHL